MNLPALAHRRSFVVVAGVGLGMLALIGWGWAQGPPASPGAEIEAATRAALQAEARTQALTRRVERLESRLDRVRVRGDRLGARMHALSSRLRASMGDLREATSAAAASAEAAGSAASSADQRAQEASAQAEAAMARLRSVAEDLSLLDQRFDYHLGQGGG